VESVAIFGGSKLGQRVWRPGSKVWSIAFFGSSELDFRQAELEEDVTQVVAVSVFGGSKVIIPQDMPVTLSGLSILGGREMKRSQPSQPKEMSPVSAKALNISAISIFGGFTVSED